MQNISKLIAKIYDHVQRKAYSPHTVIGTFTIESDYITVADSDGAVVTNEPYPVHWHDSNDPWDDTKNGYFNRFQWYD